MLLICIGVVEHTCLNLYSYLKGSNSVAQGCAFTCKYRHQYIKCLCLGISIVVRVGVRAFL